MKTPLATSYHFDPSIPFRKNAYKADENTAPIFNTICIQTYGHCNYGCKMCPSQKISNNNSVTSPKEMDWNLYKKIVDDLSSINYVGKVGLYFQSEPFLDSQLIERIKYLKEKCPKCVPNTYSNGSLLTKQKIIDTMEAGMVYFWINTYNDKDNAKIAAILKELKVSHPHFFGKDVGLQNAKCNHKIIRFLEVNKRDSPKDSTKYWNNRGGILQGKEFPILEEPLQKPCSQPIRQMFLSVSGDMSFCCADWNEIYKFCNVKDHHILEMWNNDDIQRARKALINKRRDLLLMCDKCSCGSGSFPHMLRVTDTLPNETVEEGAKKLKDKYQASFDKNFETVNTDLYDGDNDFSFVKKLNKERKATKTQSPEEVAHQQATEMAQQASTPDTAQTSTPKKRTLKIKRKS